MSVEELSLLHRRYVDLSQRFRAAWVFHQFLQSLAKLYFETFDNRYPAEFQRLYADIKDISQNLNATEAQRLTARFDGLERQIGELIQALLAEDNRVDPSLLRQFFHRFRSYDEKILIQLIRFYAYSHEGGVWQPDRLDKLDYLITRLGEEEQEGSGQAVVRDRKLLLEVFNSLATLVGDSAATREAAARRQEIDALRTEVLTVDGLDDLNGRQLVPRYRALKHGLGDLFFSPEVLMAVLETNLAMKNTVRRLYRREERRIYSEYQQIFDLEREVRVGDDLDQELARFRADIERFEQQLRSDDVRLDELARLRERARVLIPRLTGQPAAAPSRDAPQPAPPPERPTPGARMAPEAPPVEEPPPPVRAAPEDELVGGHFERLLEALAGTTLGAPAKVVTLTPDLFPFRLEPREVVAYRRLSQTANGNSPAGLGGETERFVLKAASLRMRMLEEVEEIRGLLDDTAGNPHAPIYSRARATSRLGDDYLGRFAHYIHQAVVDGQPDEARQLEVLRVRLMRDFSTLWLLAYKRLIAETAE
jgi:hypothetical protein